MKCSKCNNEILELPLEKEIRQKIGVPSSDLCMNCRKQIRLDKLPKFVFQEEEDAIDGSKFLTGSPYVGQRRIVKLDNYGKFLDIINSQQEE